MTKYAIVDLDGTLADISGIVHLIGQWDDFGEASCECPYDRKMLEVVDALASHFKILIVTGRSEKYRRKTEAWLYRAGVEVEALLMRPLDNYESDATLKPKLVEAWLGRHQIKPDLIPEHLRGIPDDWTQKIALAIEDRDKMVEAWRNLGILTFQHCVGTY